MKITAYIRKTDALDRPWYVEYIIESAKYDVRVDICTQPFDCYGAAHAHATAMGAQIVDDVHIDREPLQELVCPYCNACNTAYSTDRGRCHQCGAAYTYLGLLEHGEWNMRWMKITHHDETCAPALNEKQQAAKHLLDTMFGYPAHVTEHRLSACIECNGTGYSTSTTPNPISGLPVGRCTKGCTPETAYKRQKIAELDTEIARRRELLGDAPDAIAFTASYEALRDEMAEGIANEQAGERARTEIVDPADDYFRDAYDELWFGGV